MLYNCSIKTFNPRSYKRSDGEVMGYSADIILSIHAPTRGATFIKLFFDFGGFFQSTLLQEERHPDTFVLSPCNSFNPRSYKRSDLVIHLSLINAVLSIHAPTRGATLQHVRPQFLLYLSIHAPTRGAT